MLGGTGEVVVLGGTGEVVVLGWCWGSSGDGVLVVLELELLRK